MRNWAGTIDYTASELARPRSMDELSALITSSPSIRAAGSAHSFNACADAAVMVTTAELGERIEVSADRVWVPAHVRYAELAPILHQAGWALPALASLPHISVAGSIAMGTHGTGNHTPSLAAQVTALDLVDGSGELVTLTRGDHDYAGAVVNLGALGVVTRVQLQLQPTFEVAQRVILDLAWSVVEERFDELTSAATSVSLFTRYGAGVDEVWLKQRLDHGDLTEECFGGQPARVPIHPVRTLPPDNVTEQLGVPGAWWQRWPHFIPDAAPASGKEIQSEFFVRRDHAVEAIGVLRGLHQLLDPVLMISEIRTVAADDLWLSPAADCDVVGLHLTWHPRLAEVMPVLARVETELARFAPRVHWGKLVADWSPVASRWPKADEYASLARRHDPQGRFANDWWRQIFG